MLRRAKIELWVQNIGLKGSRELPVGIVGNGYLHTSPKHMNWRVKKVIGVLLVKNYKVINGAAINCCRRLCQSLQSVMQEANLSEFAVRLKVERGGRRGVGHIDRGLDQQHGDS